MKKVSLVVMDRDRRVSLEKLREVGVIHLERKNVSSDVLGGLLERRAALRKAMGLVRRYPVPAASSPEDFKVPPVPKTADVSPFPVEDVPDDDDLVRLILDLGDEKKTLQDQVARESKERRRVEEWGNFDPRSFAFFAGQGITLIPYELPLKVYEALGEDVRLIVFSRDKRIVRALAVGAEIPGESPFALPERSLLEMDTRIADMRKRLGEIEGSFARLALRRESLETEFREIQGHIEFETARAGMETLEDVPAEKTVSWLSGFVPQDSLGLLKRAAAENGWALVSDDPEPSDRPPTLVRNNPVVRIIHPLFSFLGTVPGYREYDISQSYLIFFCLFFAMIFGDAAYGLLLFIGSFAVGLSIKGKGPKKAKFPDAAKLFMLLSFCTVIWGSITGSWFSIPAERLSPFLRALVIPPFNSSGPLAAFPPVLQKVFNLPAEVPVDDLKTRWNIQFLCFSVGVIQLVWGRSKNIRKLLPSLTALAQMGWLIMMVGFYFLVLFMLLKVPLPPFSVYLIIGGLGMYFVFAEQNGGNFFKNIGKSFANFLSVFLNAVGSFADIISYIRLFAVGLAGGIIAQSFNTMAIPAGGFGNIGVGFVLRLAASVLILFFGHTLNIVMNALSVIVHGVRLNLLEYAGNHLGMEWSGYAYNPFAEGQKKNQP